MEEETSRRNGKKRQLVEISGDGSADEVYRFKILLPNGTSVGLNVRVRVMLFEDFITLVKEEYFRVLQYSESMKRKRQLNWKVGSLILQDTDDVKLERSVLNFRSLKPHKCHILRLHVSIDMDFGLMRVWFSDILFAYWVFFFLLVLLLNCRTAVEIRPKSSRLAINPILTKGIIDSAITFLNSLI